MSRLKPAPTYAKYGRGLVGKPGDRTRGARLAGALELNPQLDVFAVRCRRGSITHPADTDEDQAHDHSADSRGEQHDARHLEHPQDDVDADVFRRRRLLDDVDDDRFLLKEEHRYLELTTPRLRVECELGERPDADAGGALRLIGLRVFSPGGAGDVHVNPGQAVRELLDEERAGNGAAGPAARVGEVGNLALEQIEIVVEERHRPAAIARALARLSHAIAPGV